MKNCQHCGAELTNPRAKNCAECSSILSDAYRSNAYASVMSAISDARAAHLSGGDVHDMMRAAMRAGVDEHNRVADEIRDRAAQRAQEREDERRARDSYYREHGYWPTSVHPDNEDVLSAHDAAERGLDARNILDIHPFED
jgi:hypothetical protein